MDNYKSQFSTPSTTEAKERWREHGEELMYPGWDPTTEQTKQSRKKLGILSSMYRL